MELFKVLFYLFLLVITISGLDLVEIVITVLFSLAGGIGLGIVDAKFPDTESNSPILPIADNGQQD